MPLTSEISSADVREEERGEQDVGTSNAEVGDGEDPRFFHLEDANTRFEKTLAAVRSDPAGTNSRPVADLLEACKHIDDYQKVRDACFEGFGHLVPGRDDMAYAEGLKTIMRAAIGEAIPTDPKQEPNYEPISEFARFVEKKGGSHGQGALELLQKARQDFKVEGEDRTIQNIPLGPGY